MKCARVFTLEHEPFVRSELVLGVSEMPAGVDPKLNSASSVRLLGSRHSGLKNQAGTIDSCIC